MPLVCMQGGAECSYMLAFAAGETCCLSTTALVIGWLCFLVGLRLAVTGHWLVGRCQIAAYKLIKGAQNKLNSTIADTKRNHHEARYGNQENDSTRERDPKKNQPARDCRVTKEEGHGILGACGTATLCQSSCKTIGYQFIQDLSHWSDN